MNRVIVVVALLLFTTVQASDKRLPHYQLQVSVDVPQQQLRVTGSLTTGATDKRLLWPGTNLTFSRLQLNSKSVAPTAIVLEAVENTLEFEYSGSWPVSQESPIGISAAGTFLPAHSGWYPVLEGQPNFSYELVLTIDSGQKLVSSGEIVSERDIDTGYAVTVVSRQPMRAINLFGGPYQIAELKKHNIRIRTYFHEELADLAQDYLQSSAAYLADYQELIGEFPYRSFHIVAAPFSAGFGYQGLTYIGRRVLRLPFIRATSLRHEILHSYWGQGVFVDYESGNWSEGLTTYLADYRTAQQHGPDDARRMRHQWLRDYAALPAERDRPARSFIAKSHGASQVIGYHKVALLFHALKREMGEAGFERALRQFWNRYQFQVASWSDIQAIMEEHADGELHHLFTRHLDKTSAPQLMLDSVEASQLKDQWQVKFDLTQRSPAAKLNIPLRLTDAAGNASELMVDLHSASKAFQVMVPGKPVELAVDPDFHLFRQLSEGEAPPILRDLQLSDLASVLYASDNDLTRTVAKAALRRLSPPAEVSLSAVESFSGPTLVIGYSTDVADVLSRLGLSVAPPHVAGKGTARVWTQKAASGVAIAVVEADNADAMRQLVRPLPHYGRQSYLVFDGRRAVIKGNWPIEQKSLSFHFK